MDQPITLRPLLTFIKLNQEFREIETEVVLFTQVREDPEIDKLIKIRIYQKPVKILGFKV